MVAQAKASNNLDFLKIEQEGNLPAWATRDLLVDFLHYKMEPYQDSKEDIERALDYVFKGPGGFVMLCRFKEELAGILVMLNTGMKGYIPENILLMVSVDPELRGNGIGKSLIEHCLSSCTGDVKLHVEYDNPAKRLYENIGFSSKYAEMRYQR